MPKLSKELKVAIVQMPLVQKDALLLKLIAKDDILVEQLNYEIVEEKHSLQARIEFLKTHIRQHIQPQKIYYSTPSELTMVMRSVNAKIAEHMKITKDKASEIELTLLMLNTPFETCWQIMNAPYEDKDNLALYLIKRTQFALSKLNKLDEDYHIDFRKDVNLLLKKLHDYVPTKIIIGNLFPIPKTF